MCTIISANRETFDMSPEDFVDRIYEDAKNNGHGFCLILMGERADQVSVLKALDIEMIVAALRASSWSRFWFHSRYATGTYRGLPGVHGFHARHDGTDWFVMHNGVLHHKESSRYNVDSQWIADLIDSYGPNSAGSVLQNNERFANCFFVAPDKGKWYMLRMNGGTLYQSADQQCFSTIKIDGIIENLVPDNTFLVFDEPLAAAPTVSRGTVYGSGGRGSTTTPKLPTTTESGPSPTTTTEEKKPLANPTTLGWLASLNGRTNLGRDWIRSGRGVWFRQEGDVLLFNGREPKDKRKVQA